MDVDILRLKLISELEGPHKHAIDIKNKLIEDLQSDNFNLKRNLENIKSEYENYRTNSEKDYNTVIERNKEEVSSLLSDI